MNMNNDDETAVQICRSFHHSLLDSSLIVTTNKFNYNVKIINCNNYIQVYFFPNSKLKKDKNIEKIDTDNLIKQENNKKIKKELEPNNNIELKNIMRSKLECQRLAKANIEDWKIFITLTFDPKKATCSLKNIVNTNKRFRYFIDKVQRIKKDLKYICVPEFHKSGIVHYHLLTNIDINDKNLIYTQEDNPKFKHIKYWNDGFTSVEVLKGDPKKIIGYIAKYMTKDIDNRLFNRHRYLYSRNLKKPIVSYLDLSNNKDFDYYFKLLNNKNIIYENEYINPYNDSSITFKEYL